MNRRELIKGGILASIASLLSCVASVTVAEHNPTDDDLDRLLSSLGWPKCDICGRVSRSGARDFVCTGLEVGAKRFELGDRRYRCGKHGPARSFTFYPALFAPDGEGWYERDKSGVESRVR